MLILEALGDVGKLLDRVDEVKASLAASCEALSQASAALQAQSAAIDARITRLTDAATAHVVKHIAQQADKATRQSIDLHLRAMDEAAQALFTRNVGPAIHRLTQPLQRLYEVVKETSNPWNSWLTHAASAILAGTLTWFLLSGLWRP
ncbi:hypothetical protein SNE35_02670 [Paucibacter sp. R3-3]|uniref:Uncharacterized protein n=1 Tax=Roseateles agri TaxID=3098619 RepID=A0ABU5DC79_9BURK|nr:hypothetical protein [Paucibacter sp. R3-3]MDY0743386.1 hypothetical protein [Paucibacter sp. R3-3]